ncbi:hypothetical protein ANO14919_088790 [Xylariales sp. No.14919]|nr:hypothetical protein ANO14919_088790 [Xylariales sp. No.14919]
MNFTRTFLSKRKLAKLVDNGKAWGWDDLRMPTIRGVGRRGITTPALRDFILKQGPSRNVVTMDWTSYWAANKNEIDPVAPQHTAISKKDRVKVPSRERARLRSSEPKTSRCTPRTQPWGRRRWPLARRYYYSTRPTLRASRTARQLR